MAAAFCAANGVILYQEKKPFEVIFTNVGFYIASICSCLFAYGAIVLVIWVTRFLDYRLPWHTNYSKRLFWQLVLGVVFPVLPLFIAAAIYFNRLGINVLKTVYISRYIPLIVLLLVVLSAYLHLLWEKKHRGKKTPKSLLAQKTTQPPLPLPFAEIAYLFAENKSCYVVNYFGEKTGWDLTLKDTMTQLPTNRFFQLHRSLIINLKAIEDIKVIDPKRTTVMLFDPLPNPLNDNKVLTALMKEVSPSARENATFKSWYVRHKPAHSL
ncbi:LytTR family DNA-binding domain-containing protein [Pedobacter frigiditerrae]|nr:LytTR family DNA-binding domain-containing protein [Pedobacter frigiditerrae]